MIIKKINEFVTESKNTYDYGCMMLGVKLESNISSKIEENDIYTEIDDDSYGIEKETHITIKYGFTDKVSDHDILNICRDTKFGEIRFNKVSIFENKDYDVLKFDIKSNVLDKLNKKLSTFPNEDKYPEYKSHCTIAYIKKGKGLKYVDMFKDIDMIGIPDKLIYSNSDGTKLILNL